MKLRRWSVEIEVLMEFVKFLVEMAVFMVVVVEVTRFE